MKRLGAFVVLAAWLTTASAATNRWTDVNADPYRAGGIVAALNALTPYGFPLEGINAVADCFRKKAFRKGEVKRGGSGLAMVYGTKSIKVMPNVQYAWEKFTGLETEDCEYRELLVRRAVVCNNFLLERKAPIAVAPPPPPPQPEKKAPPLPPAEPRKEALVGPTEHYKHLHVRAVLPGPIASKLLSVDGSQSRDLKGEILKGLQTGAVKTYPGCVTYRWQFINIDFARARRDVVIVNRSEKLDIPENFGETDPKTGLKIDSFVTGVCGSPASLGVRLQAGGDPPSWIDKKRSRIVVVITPSNQYRVLYPDSMRLKTCSTEWGTEEYCGTTWTKRNGELYEELAEKQDNSFAHVLLEPAE